MMMMMKNVDDLRTNDYDNDNRKCRYSVIYNRRSLMYSVFIKINNTIQREICLVIVLV